jgi:glycosyltransferase involved in cell wall biosynthesis
MGGIREVAGSAAAVRLVPMGDVEALAGAAEQLASARGSGRQRRGQARTAALARFSLDRRAAELEAVFDLAAAALTRPEAGAWV